MGSPNIFLSSTPNHSTPSHRDSTRLSILRGNPMALEDPQPRQRLPCQQIHGRSSPLKDRCGLCIPTLNPGQLTSAVEDLGLHVILLQAHTLVQAM